MKLHGVLEDVELMPPGLGNEKVVDILSQRFIFTKAKERLKLSIDVQNFRAARNEDGFRRSVQ